jgi:hypothetical protein
MMKSLRILKNRQKRRGMLRVLAYFMFIWAICTFVSLRHARAEFNDRTLELGRQMAFLSKASRHEQTNINFNGQKIRIGNDITDASPQEVLSRYEDYCNGNSSAFLKEGDAKDGPKDAPGAEKSGFIRVKGSDADGDGAVICFVRGTESKPTRKEAFQAFVDSGNLGAIGELRYAYVRKADSGKSVVLTAWTDSNFNILRIAPKTNDSDVEGQDFPEVPRPENAIRVISASAEGTPYAANVYRTTQPVEKVIGFYDKTMQDKGWFMFDPELKEDADGTKGRAYWKQGVVLTVSAHNESDGTYVGLGLAGVGHEEKIGKIQ